MLGLNASPLVVVAYIEITLPCNVYYQLHIFLLYTFPSVCFVSKVMLLQQTSLSID